MGWAVHLATMETHATFVRFPTGDIRFCDTMFSGASEGKEDKRAVEGEKKQSSSWCRSLEGEHEIQEVAMHMCAPVVKLIWPQFCDGLNNAYQYGVMLIVVAVTNLIAQLIGCYFLYDYITRKANPTYRTTGLALLGCGGFAMVFATAVYGTMVVDNLDSVGGSGWTAALLTTGKNHGFGPGFVCIGCGCALQFCQVFWTPYVAQEDDEIDYLEAKAQKLEDREYGTFNKAGNMGGFGGAPAMSPSPIMMQPAMQPAPMMVQTGPQPMMGAPMMGGAQMMGGPAMGGGGFGPTAPSVSFGAVEHTTIITSGGPGTAYEPGPSVPTELSAGAIRGGGGGGGAAF
eukprot:SRR837773.4203.p2 GENE.SRR837773.4203~~SRR837773.4203.p2  ORF type:complete len:398 (-),score=108.85 SRR837773.4203:131-1159(-)